MKIHGIIILLVLFSSCQGRPAGLHQDAPGLFRADGFQSQGRYSLGGTWLSSPSLQGEDYLPQPVPGGWGVQGANLSGDSHYLFAKVFVPGASGMWTLELPNIFCAYRLWVNGSLIHTQGTQVSEGWDDYIADVRPAQASFLWSGDKAEIVLEVVNFTNQKGGIQGPILLSPSTSAQISWKFDTAGDHFMAGVCFLLFLFHLFQFFATRMKWADFHLAMISFFVFFRILLTGQKVFSWVLNLPYELHYDLEFATVFFIVHFLTLYIKHLFPQEKKFRIALPLLSLNLVFALLLIPLDNQTFVLVFDYYLLIILPLMGLNLVKVLRAYHQGHTGSRILMGAIVSMIVIGLFDVGFALGLHTLGSYSSFGFIGFLLVQFYLLLSRSAWEDRQAQMIAAELQKKNLQQSHFMANTSHELKTPLHGLLGMSELLYQSGSLPEEVRQELETLSGDLKQLNTTMDRLLRTEPEEPDPKPDL